MTEKTKWELYKEKKQTDLQKTAQPISEENRNAKPWDILDPSMRAEEEVSDQRYSICLSCPELINMTKQCKRCGCFMALKTKVKHASCPIGKW